MGSAVGCWGIRKAPALPATFPSSSWQRCWSWVQQILEVFGFPGGWGRIQAPSASKSQQFTGRRPWEGRGIQATRAKGDLGSFPTNFSASDKAGGSELEQFIKSGLPLGDKFEHLVPTSSSNDNKLDLQIFI